MMYAVEVPPVSTPRLVVLVPSVKGEMLLSLPAVSVSVPETEPVPWPVSAVGVEMVTPEALELLMVKLVKLALGEADRFLNVPLPLITCALGDAEKDTVLPSKKVELLMESPEVEVKTPPAFTVRLPFT